MFWGLRASGEHAGAVCLHLDFAAYRLSFLRVIALRAGGDLHYMTPFVSVFISYTFLSWDSLAEELEDPFGTSANDLPLNAMCNTIERNLMDMTGQHPLPEKCSPTVITTSHKNAGRVSPSGVEY